MVEESKKMTKLTELAQTHLVDGEYIKYKLIGTYNGKLKGYKVPTKGILLATNKRVLFFNKRNKKSIDYAELTSVELIRKKLSSDRLCFTYNGEEIQFNDIKTKDQIDIFSSFLKSPKYDSDTDFQELIKDEENYRQIKETKCTCSACGNVWYYGKEDAIANFGEKLESAGNSMSNAGKNMMCCGGCWPALFMPEKEEKKVRDLNQCPVCGSKAVKKETVVHNVE